MSPPAEDDPSVSDERRQEDNRYAVKLPAYIHVGPDHIRYRGYVMNLSVKGIFVTVKEKTELGPNVYLTFNPGPNIVCEASGGLAYQMGFGNGVGFGANFDRQTDTYITFIKNLSTASQVDIMMYMRFIKRMKVWVW